MARDWRDLFIIDGPVPADGESEAVPEQRVGRFRRLRESLRKTRQALQSEIQATLFEDLSDETWERLEEALIYADVGASTTAKVVAQLEQEAAESKLTGGQELSDRLVELLAEIARTGDDTIDLRAEPTVILVAGGEHDVAAHLARQVPGELAERRRLARAVDAGDEDHRRLGAQVDRVVSGARDLGEQLDESV
jgi:hypothetical protein